MIDMRSAGDAEVDQCFWRIAMALCKPQLHHRQNGRSEVKSAQAPVT